VMAGIRHAHPEQGCILLFALLLPDRTVVLWLCVVQFDFVYEEHRRERCYCGAAICPGFMNWDPEEGVRPDPL
jgi:hypothetical protein